MDKPLKIISIHVSETSECFVLRKSEEGGWGTVFHRGLHEDCLRIAEAFSKEGYRVFYRPSGEEIVFRSLPANPLTFKLPVPLVSAPQVIYLRTPITKEDDHFPLEKMTNMIDEKMKELNSTPNVLHLRHLEIRGYRYVEVMVLFTPIN